MGSRTEVYISDLTVAQPTAALLEKPVPDRWLVIPYEGEISGKMLWCPSCCQPPDVAVQLLPLGLCRIYIGIYSSGTVPIWYNIYAPSPENKAWNRILLRLSDEDWFETIVPEHYAGQPRFVYISEAFWKTADVTGKSLVFAPPTRKEAFVDTHALIAYVRLVPTDSCEEWSRDTKRLVTYYDSNFCGHYVDSASDIKSYICPLKDSDFATVLWTTCREDTCYYPTRVGNRFTYDGTLGVYPYWAGRDLERMLARGEDPLRIACDVAHDCGLELFVSYRRMTCRMPPFVFPLHPDGILMKRRDLWCADQQGKPLPHLSLAWPDVRARMIALLSEQAENSDTDGVHLFFCRGVLFVFFEEPFLAAFREEYGEDARRLPLDDERVWKVRARFVVQFLRELRAALDRIGQRKGKRLCVALSVMNAPRTCLYYGLDILAIVRERLADMLLPSHAAFWPRELGGEWRCAPEFVAEFAQITRGSGLRLCPEPGINYWTDRKVLKVARLARGGADVGSEEDRPCPASLAEWAAEYYAAGADGLLVNGVSGQRSALAVSRRLGHVAHLSSATEWARAAARMVRVDTVGVFPLDHQTGIPTVG